jgi:hypothetical protein
MMIPPIGYFATGLKETEMPWDSALGSIIEVAIALAGFAGIVAAVGRRGSGQWSAADQLLLRVLLLSSGAAIIFAFLPFILIDVLELSTLCRVLSALLALWLSAVAIFRIRQSMSHGITEVWDLRLRYFIGGGLVVVVSLLITNALWLASPSLYLVGLLWQVTISFVTFVTLLLNSWRDEPAAKTTPTPPAQ